MAARGCTGETKCWHWSFAKPQSACVSSALSSSAERRRGNRHRRKHGPDSVFSMHVADAKKVTPVFPIDRSGKLSEILRCELKDRALVYTGDRIALAVISGD